MPFTGQGTGIQNANDVFFSGVSRGDSLRYNSTTAKWNNTQTEYINVLDYGVTGDGSPADLTRIQTAIGAIPPTGGTIVFPAVHPEYLIEQITFLNPRSHLVIPAGVTLRRPAASTQTGPIIIIQRNSCMISGFGVVKADNDCPNGVISVGRSDGTCEWTRIENISIKGPGKAVANSVGLVFTYITTYQNNATNVVVSDVSKGIIFSGEANMNEVHGVNMYNIGTVCHTFDNVIECGIVGGSVSKAAGTTVFDVINASSRNVISNYSAEPGAGSVFWNIETGCVKNMFCGCNSNVTTIGTDNGTETTAILSGLSKFQGTVI